MISLGHLFALLGGVLWGISTPLMKTHSSQLVWLHKANTNFFVNTLNVLKSLLLSWKFIAFFGLNQLGSVLYTISLSYNPITISVPISNSVNLAIIVLLGCYKEKIDLNWRSTIGILLVFVGVILCLLAPRAIHKFSAIRSRLLANICGCVRICSASNCPDHVASEMAWTDFISDYVDIDFVRWLIWLFTPLLIAFLLPLIIILLIYMSALIIFIYRHRHKLDLTKIVDEIERKHYWSGALHAIAVMWEAHGYIWHGYEVEGLHNIPDNGPALLVYYHGAIPIDYYYLSAKCLLYKKRLIYSVGDKFLFKIPGWAHLMEVLKVFPGSIQTCVKVLNEGNLLAISPGGVREAQFGTENYNLVWAGRVGFAKVAMQARVPIIPVFTQNIREAFRTVQIGRSIFRKIYDKYKFPMMAIYGGFPVKLKTIVGEPIYLDPQLSAEEITDQVANAIEEMIRKNQIIPGSILRALTQRIYKYSEEKVV